ncbi:MAG: hypothetical protein D3904_13985 [Candidatus Electrothrix sp. EH2]|nr:hypothetical protein [Candidatus Electrothrix sp. EH2]
MDANMEVTRANLLGPNSQPSPRRNEPDDTLLDFKFDDPEDGLSREKYDVCFIFPFNFSGPITQNELAAIARFMEEGGGVFATGDHEELGALVCQNIPRVRYMRKWIFADGVPSRSGEDRLSTMLSGDDEMHEFADESDINPQRVYLNRRTDAGGLGNPHPLMQTKESGGNVAIVHIPDHPHEGECVIPEDLETTFELDGENRQEWPLEVGGEERLSPEIVAKSMSAGGPLYFSRGDQTKDVPILREFIAIAAYDGHRAGVGRVVTDATWHHFLDINIDGTGSGPRDGERRYGLMLPPSDGNSDPVDDSPALIRLRQHWRNLAEWLMPSEGRRRCAAVIHIAGALPENLDELVNLSPGDLGGRIKMNLDEQILPYQVNDLLETVLAMGISDPAERRAARDRNNQIDMMALGALTAALFELEPGTVEEMLVTLEEAVAAAVESVRETEGNDHSKYLRTVTRKRY